MNIVETNCYIVSEEMTIILILLVLIFSGECKGTEFEIINRENETIWVGLKGLQGYEHLENGGFVLESGKSKILTPSNMWSGWVWARTFCNETTQKCLTGDCRNGLKCNGKGGNRPFTYAVFQDWYGIHLYTISFADGFNVPVSIQPILDGDNSDVEGFDEFYCKTSSCAQNLKDGCPKKFLYKNGTTVVGCHSPCGFYLSDEFCCQGRYSDRDVCRSVALPVEYEEYFNKHCPDGNTNIHGLLRFRCHTKKFVVTFGTLVPVS